MKKAFITGITGQTGSYLADLLLLKNYDVYGFVRWSSQPNLKRLEHILDKITILYGDISDYHSILSAISQIKPDEIYNLAALSHVKDSFELPLLSGDVTGLGLTRILEATRNLNLKSRIYQASSSELFGNSSAPQNEKTIFDPRSPYACAKLYAFQMAKLYREAYNMHISNGILFNHESPRRSDSFVTRKVTKAVARIKLGSQEKLWLGNLDARRDWGHAKDYAEGMWMMLQQEHADDYVLATGKSHSVRELVEVAFNYVGLNWKNYVRYDSAYNRPAEVNYLLGDPTKAQQKLGWHHSIEFEDLIKEMIDNDVRLESK